MNIELAVTGITAQNRRIKLIKAAHALSDQMGLGAAIDYPVLEKSHKYLDREWRNGGWVYTYPDTGGGGGAGEVEVSEPPLIIGVTPIAVTAQNYGEVAKQEFKKLEKKIKEGLLCPAVDGRRVAGMRRKHLKETKGKKRVLDTVIRRASLMPYIIPIIENGIMAEKRETPEGPAYKILGKIDTGKEVSVILIEDKKTDLLYFSVFDNERVMNKSQAQSSGSIPGGTSRFPAVPVGQGTYSSSRTVIIPGIWAKSIETYPDIEVLIQNITRQNRKAKFIKAIRAVSKALKEPVAIGHKRGESYLYPVQQELADKWAGFYEPLLRNIYAVVTATLGLPKAEVETLRKSLGDGLLRYRGEVLYHPETGEPLKKKDFEALIQAIEKFLNRNTADTGKQIVLDAVAIEKLLKRMAKYQSSKEMEALTLDTLKYRGKTFDWIREDIKNIRDAFRIDGYEMSRAEMARYQVAQDYVAQLVTRVNNDIKDEIKDVVLNGIVERRSKSQVSQDLFNRLGSLNRDWRRIANTEMVNTANLAGILEEVNRTPPGEKVYFKRYELAGCCDKCAEVNGKIVLWSDVPLDGKVKDEDKIGDSFAGAIWEGKPREKGKAGVLVPGTLHPHCRGGWVRWGGKQEDAMSVKIHGKMNAWNKAVQTARAEWRAKGIKNPHDQTPGYTERINDLYREELEKQEGARN